MIFWAKYGTQTTFQFPMVKAGAIDLAVSGDWTPAAADSAISKNLGNWADTTNTVAIGGGTPTRGVTGWQLTLTATELQAARVDVQIIDAATKTVEDQFFTVYTYGNASAMYAGDWSDIVRQGLTALPNAAAGGAAGLPVVGTGSNNFKSDASANVTLADASLTTAKLGTFALAKTTNITGFNDIAATAVVSAGAITTSGGAVSTVTSVTNPVTAGTVSDKTGYSLSSAGIQAIWDALTSALVTIGSIGKLLVDNINATISSRSSHSAADVWAVGTRALTDKAGFSISGTKTTLDALNDIAAADVWAVGTRALTDKAGFSIASGGIDSGAITAAELNAMADAFLDRNMATGTDSGTDSTVTRTVRQALRVLRNKRAVAAGVLTVRKEDDTTASWTAAITTAAGNPVDSIDPT